MLRHVTHNYHTEVTVSIGLKNVLSICVFAYVYTYVNSGQPHFDNQDSQIEVYSTCPIVLTNWQLTQCD